MIGAVVVHYDENGVVSFHAFGDESVRLFIVDERAPNDRVYEIIQRRPPEELRDLIKKGESIGNSGDARHAAIENKILSDMRGKPHLGLVEP